MEISVFIAKALGLYYLIISLAMLINRRHFKPLLMEFIANPQLMFLSGFMALIIGILMVISHNIWVTDWRVVITSLAWVALFKGISSIFFPNCADTLTREFIENERSYYIMGAFVLLLGLFLSYHGFF